MNGAIELGALLQTLCWRFYRYRSVSLKRPHLNRLQSYWHPKSGENDKVDKHFFSIGKAFWEKMYLLQSQYFMLIEVIVKSSLFQIQFCFETSCCLIFRCNPQEHTSERFLLVALSTKQFSPIFKLFFFFIFLRSFDGL